MRSITLTSLVALLCASGAPLARAEDPSAAARPSAAGKGPCCSRSLLSASARRALVLDAVNLLGAARIEVDGRTLPLDCSSLVRGVYLRFGIDLYSGIDIDEADNGVRLIHRHVATYGRLHRRQPRPGDVVFFDNTWDRSGEGRLDDHLTHIGIVERVGRDGTVVFISHVSRGVRRYRMNLASPHAHRGAKGRLLNDFLRRRQPDDPPGTPYLAAELFAGFGTLGVPRLRAALR